MSTGWDDGMGVPTPKPTAPRPDVVESPAPEVTGSTPFAPPVDPEVEVTRETLRQRVRERRKQYPEDSISLRSSQEELAAWLDAHPAYPPEGADAGPLVEAGE